MAIGLTLVALVLIVSWDENYGDAHETPGVSGPGSNKGPFSLLSSVTDTLAVVSEHPAVLCLGLSQAFFEGAVYTFGERIASSVQIRCDTSPGLTCCLVVNVLACQSSCGCPRCCSSCQLTPPCPPA